MVDLESLVSRHVAVLGSSGQGKSCFTAAVLQQIAKMPKARVVIFDINGEYEDAFLLPAILREPSKSHASAGQIRIATVSLITRWVAWACNACCCPAIRLNGPPLPLPWTTSTR